MDEADRVAQPEVAINYATPAPRRGMGPSWLVHFTALGLIFLGGCFLVGILTLNSQASFHAGPPGDKTAGQIILEVVLYLAAGGCFGGAIALILLGIKWIRDAKHA